MGWFQVHLIRGLIYWSLMKINCGEPLPLRPFLSLFLPFSFSLSFLIPIFLIPVQKGPKKFHLFYPFSHNTCSYYYTFLIPLSRKSSWQDVGGISLIDDAARLSGLHSRTIFIRDWKTSTVSTRSGPNISTESALRRSGNWGLVPKLQLSSVDRSEMDGVWKENETCDAPHSLLQANLERTARSLVTYCGSILLCAGQSSTFLFVESIRKKK